MIKELRTRNFLFLRKLRYKMVKYVKKRKGVYWPNRNMKKIALMSDSKIYKKAGKNPQKFWAELSKQGLDWFKMWDKTYEESLPYFKWFKGGKINLCYNAVDRHLKERPNEVAIKWIPEPTNEERQNITYQELYDKVNKFANVLKNLGVKKGDSVGIYMPLIPQALVAMLSCARIGAIHTVVFSAFSAESLKQRLKDGGAKVLVTADGYYRRGKQINLINQAKQGAKNTKVKKIVAVNRLGKVKTGKKVVSYEEEMKKAGKECKPAEMESNEPLFLLYTSGTTGKPKGIIHDTGGYATQAYWTARWNFDLHEDKDIMWCTADIGWITGHTYACYGPLLNGATTLIYEGAPDCPDLERWWQILDENHVSVFYTAPTAVRMFMRDSSNALKKYEFDKLKVLGTVGEPIDEDAWNWYFENIGKGRCPLIDTWWQTETGGTLINSLPGIGPFIPTIAGRSFPGTKHIVVDEEGKKLKKGQKGFLVQKSPFAPGMLRGIWGRTKSFYKKKYWRFEDMYATEDSAILTKNGFRILGRADDVMKVAGHRLATAEVENVIERDKLFSECAVVPKADKVRGQVPVAFVILKKGKPDKKTEKRVIDNVVKGIGPTAKPHQVIFVDDLPKTRSGKIMRRILKALIAGETISNTSTLVNPESVSEIEKILKNK